MFNAKFTIEITVPFHEYDSIRKTKKAIMEIEKNIKESINDNLNFIPFYIEKDTNGSFIEDCSRRTKIIIKRVKNEKS